MDSFGRSASNWRVTTIDSFSHRAADARELAELCEAARDSESDGEFERHFLEAADRRKRFEKLRECWACDAPTARERLRRVHIHTIDERELRVKVPWGVAALFLANPTTVVNALRGIAEDSVHHTVSRQGLVERLTQGGFPLRRLRNPWHAGVAVQTATDRYLDIARRKLIQRKLVSKAATETLLSRLDGTPSDSVVTGRAGSGKTACVVEILERLRAGGCLRSRSGSIASLSIGIAVLPSSVISSTSWTSPASKRQMIRQLALTVTDQ